MIRTKGLRRDLIHIEQLIGFNQEDSTLLASRRGYGLASTRLYLT